MQRMIVLPILFVILTIFALNLSTTPTAHGQIVGVVCVAAPPITSTSGCPTSPVNIAGGAVGTKVVVGINIDSSDALNGFRIFVKTDITILNPVKADLNNTLLAQPILPLANCINGAGTGCSIASGDGPGVVDVGVVSLAGLTLAPTTGNLFEIVYNVAAATTGTPVNFLTGVCGVGSSVPGLCVTITNGGAAPNPETAITGTVITLPTFVLSANPSSLTINAGSSLPSTITVSRFLSGTGTVALTRAITPVVTNGPTALLSVASGSLSNSVNSFTSILTVSTTASTPPGNYNATVTGTCTATSCSSTTRSIIVPVIVQLPPPPHPTTTTVQCTPPSVRVSTLTSCMATVTDTSATGATTPTGPVSFTTNSTGTFAPVSASCTLLAGATAGTASCSVSYTPGSAAVGHHLINGTYTGDSSHSTSHGTFNLAVTAVPFDYSLSNGGPVSVVQGSSGTVTVTARLTAGSALPVTLSCVSSSLPAGVTCGSFTVNPVTPTAAGATSVLTINVASSVALGPYSFMVTGSPLGATTTPTSISLTVTGKDNTSTSVGSVSCNIALGGTSCTASVTATVADTTTPSNAPTGTVTFTLTAGTTGGSLSSPTCTLSTVSGVTSCSVTFTGTTAGSGSVSATYGGDSTHNTSTSAAAAVTVTVTSKDNTSTSVGNVSCNIALGASSCTASVIATVADTTTASNFPTSTVTFTLTPGTTGGSLSSPTCTLSTISGVTRCSVTFTGTSAGSGSIIAMYGGDSTHNTSTSSAASITVTATGKDNTSTSVGSVSCNIALGASSCTASVVATVTDTTTASNAPTGTVTFTLTAGTTGGSLSSPTCNLSTTSGVTSCSVTFTGTSAGSGSIVAGYGGDATHNTSTSAGATVTVTVTSKDNTSTSVGNVSCNIALGGTSCTASVTATVVDTTTASNAPTGAVTFTLSAGTTGGSLSSNTCNLSTTSGVTSCSVMFTGTSAGSGSVTAMYGGDSTHNTSTSSAASVTVTVSSKDNTSTSVGSVSCNIALGGTSCTASVTATVADTTTPSNAPTGTVTFTLTAGTTGGSLSSPTCTLSTVSGVASCSVTFTGHNAGSGSVSATYGGDSTHNTSTSALATVTVTSTGKDSTSTSVGNVSCNMALGASSCTAAVTATVADTTTPSSAPTGTVTFTLTAGTTGGSLSSNTCNLSTVASVTSCSVMFTGTTAGSGSITAAYSGDSTHNTSTSPSASITVTATGKDNTSTSLPQPSVGCNIALGASSCSTSVEVIVADTTTGSNAPTGTVTFALTQGTLTGSLSSTTCALSTTAGVTSCSVTFTGTSAGSGSLSASYGGDSTHNGSNAPATVVMVTFTVKDNTSTTVPNVNCNIALGSTSCAASVTATVADTTTASNVPTGTVTFTLTAGSTGGSLSSPTCTLSTVSGVTSCSVMFTGTSAGSGSVTAIYGGDSTHNTSTSTAATVTVTATLPPFDYSLSNGGPVSVVQGSSGTVTVTARLTAGSALPVTLSCVSSSLPAGVTCGSFTVNPVTPTAAGATSVLTINVASSVALGPYSFMVTGSPLGATTTPTSISLTVTAAQPHATATTVSCSPSSVQVGSQTTCTATVTDTSSSGATAPTGTVGFTSNSTGTFSPTSATCTLASGPPAGTASCSVSYTPTVAGHHMITGSYTGDSTHSGSTGSFKLAVASTAPPPLHSTKTVVTCSPGSVLAGTSTSCTARVIDNSTSSTVPTGTVAFTTNSTGTFNPSSPTCTLVAGNAPNMATCSVSYTPTVAGRHVISGSYGGDASHAKSSGSFTVNVRSATGGPVLLTFNGFDFDDFDDGVGQLAVLVNGQLVADIPAGLNHLTGTGDYRPYENAAVDFGPFDISGFVVSGQNTILFRDPTSFDHFGVVRNVRIVQGSSILLQAPRARGVYPGFSFSYTFSNPPLTVNSFTSSSTGTGPEQILTFAVTYSGGAGPFTCVFKFGDGESIAVSSSLGTCSATHDFDQPGTFMATVSVRGSSTSDLVSSSLTINVTGS